MAPGEILGVAGVSGNGQYALAEALAGLVPVTTGDIILGGASIASRISDGAIADEVAYIPERPLDNAVVADLDLGLNLTLRRLTKLPLFPQRRAINGQAGDLIKRFGVRPPNPTLAAAALSGGNLQKLVIARELSDAHRLVIACYPTMGLDVLATQAVYRSLFEQAAARRLRRLDLGRVGRPSGLCTPDRGDPWRKHCRDCQAARREPSNDRPLDGRHGARSSGVSGNLIQRSLYGAGGVILFLALASVFLLTIGRPPLLTLATMVGYAFGDVYSASESLVKATPILLCALAVILPARLGLITVGGEGQLYLGALLGTAVVVNFPGAPLFVLLPTMLMLGAAGGAIWSGLAGHFARPLRCQRDDIHAAPELHCRAAGEFRRLRRLERSGESRLAGDDSVPAGRHRAQASLERASTSVSSSLLSRRSSCTSR